MVETKTCSHDPEAIIYPSDDHLYRHYLDHTSMTLTHCDSDCAVMQIGIPVLAKKSRPVFHALLALSAACLCCDMIYKKPVPSLDYVNEVLMTGYQHYNLASEQMRELISQPDASNTDPLLASTVLLVPFAAAIQQVNHWISKRIRTPESKPLSTTPRDVIVMMRGIRSTLQTLSCDTLTIEKTGYATSISAAPWLEYDMLAAPHMSSTHVMFSIIAATSQGAFAKLRVRLESCRSDVQSSDDQLYACMEAFELLVKIRTATFSPSNLARPNKTEAEFEQSDGFESVPMSQLRSWLRFYAHRTKNPLPTEPLTRSFLDFLVQAPQAYLDLVLPLLDQRLENPRYIINENTDELTREQALALDIYAHWSVFMFLVEDESWWIGNLPIVTLTGMVNRYGGRFVTRLWPQVNDGPEQWWPGNEKLDCFLS
ncbi:hypothetical protein ACMFMF_010031 [Clarireedia jacksonii]